MQFVRFVCSLCARQRSSGSSAWYDLLPPNEVLKLLHLSGKAGLAENLWQQMAVVGVQGLIGWLVMMDVWQARWEVPKAEAPGHLLVNGWC